MTDGFVRSHTHTHTTHTVFPLSGVGACVCMFLRDSRLHQLALYHLTPPGTSQTQPREMCMHTGGSTRLESASMELEVLAYSPVSTQVAQCAHIMRSGIQRQLHAMQASMQASGTVQAHCACLFRPPGWPHSISVVYPLTKSAGKVSLTACVDFPAYLQRMLCFILTMVHLMMTMCMCACTCPILPTRKVDLCKATVLLCIARMSSASCV